MMATVVPIRDTDLVKREEERKGGRASLFFYWEKEKYTLMEEGNFEGHSRKKSVLSSFFFRSSLLLFSLGLHPEVEAAAAPPFLVYVYLEKEEKEEPNVVIHGRLR